MPRPRASTSALVIMPAEAMSYGSGGALPLSVGGAVMAIGWVAGAAPRLLGAISRICRFILNPKGVFNRFEIVNCKRRLELISDDEC